MAAGGKTSWGFADTPRWGVTTVAIRCSEGVTAASCLPCCAKTAQRLHMRAGPVAGRPGVAAVRGENVVTHTGNDDGRLD